MKTASLVTSRKHPQTTFRLTLEAAAKETLTIIIPRFVHGAVIQIVDNVVGLMVWDDYNRSKMFMWDWMTGSLVVVGFERILTALISLFK